MEFLDRVASAGRRGPQVLKALKSKGSEQTQRMYARHGASGPKVYGVNVADMKVIATTPCRGPCA